MAEDAEALPEAVAEAPPPRGRRWWQRLGRGLALLMAGLLLLAAAIGFGIDTDAGHRFIADRVGELKPRSGLRIHIGRIEGSIWRHARIRDLRLYDPRGLFLEAPEVELDWQPTRWIANRLHVDRLASPLVILRRLPQLRPTGREEPLIPGYHIHVGQLDLRLRLEPGVAGPRRMVRLVGQADTARGRAVIGLRAYATGGDRLALALDTEPDRDVFDLTARLSSPAQGVVPGLFGSHKPVELLVGGDGSWSGWKGGARLDVGGQRVADLALTEAKGLYALSGRLVPGPITQGKIQRLTTPSVRVSGAARYADRRIDGHLTLHSPSIEFGAKGVIDLARSAFDGLKLDLALLDPKALFPNMTGHDVHLHAQLDGAFRRAAFRYALTAPRFAFDQTGFEAVRAEGAGRLGGAALMLPIRLSARRVTGVGAEAGGILANLSVTGTLKVTAKLLTGDGLALRSDKLNGKLALMVDLVTGRFAVDLSGGLQRYLIPGLGIVDVLTELKVLPTGADGKGTLVTGRGRAWVRRFDNVFLRGLAGGLPQLDTQLTRSADGVLHFAGLRLTAPAITITGAGQRLKDGQIQFTGQGTQAIYGPFKLALDGLIDHPKIGLLLDHPVDALGLSAVRLDLDPVPAGFAMKASGGSTLGPFTAHGAIDAPPNAPAVIHLDGLDVTGTHASGVLRSDTGGFAGSLAVAGGGLDGKLDFSAVQGLQRILVHLLGTNASLAGDFGLSVKHGQVDADLLLDPAATKMDVTVTARGLQRGSVSLARLAGNVKMTGGRGELRASVSGSRGRTFSFQTIASLAPDAYLVRGQGQLDGKPVALATPAELRRQGDLWVLSPTSIGFAGGAATVAGRFGAQSTAFEATLDSMPLTVLDILQPGLGLSGQATGRLNYSLAGPGQLPSAKADLRIRGLSRAGLILSSRPVDVGLAAVLNGRNAAMRAVAASGGQVVGRAQARLAPLPDGGSLGDRLLNAPLFGQLRYNGAIDTLWRLTGIETIDLSGPVAIGADAGGTLRSPRIRGSLATQAARLESGTIGAVVDKIAARGRFDGSKLLIDQFAGSTKNGGSLSGRAAFDFAGAKGLGMDIALDARHAVLLNRDDIGATVTGPLTITSNGQGGTIAGDVALDKSSYRFGKAAATGVPNLPVKEINREDDRPEPAPVVPWTLDLRTDARNQMFVRGLGLDSEWRAKLAITGTVDNPAIAGRADLIRGRYEFAGRRFDLDRGIIRFSGSQPVDPALDIVASANIQSVNATIHVSGTGLKPEIDFTSVPALPEDELLSRLLFGTSIANLSAPEALQLAAAVNGLRTGGKGSLDPINAIRKIAGLDRLRIEPADVTTGQKTSIAAGKYIGKRTYVELVTDGQGYSASRIEFQVTRWLSLLSTISTIGRQSASVRVSKDY